MIGLDEPVENVRELLARDPELSRRSGAPQCEHYGAGAIDAASSGDCEESVRLLADGLDTFACENVEISTLHHLLPEGQEFLF